MTFLELVNALRREASVAGTGVTTVANQSGENARLVEWVAQAYQDIQNEYFDWRFLKKESTFNTQVITNIITPPADLNVWDTERLYDDELNLVEMIEYADLDEKIDETILGKPSRFVVKNNNTLLAYPYPDAVYTYTYDYFRNPFVLTADTDEPAFPAQYHRVILGRALVYYGNYESAPEMVEQGMQIYKTVLRSLRNNQTANKQQFYGRANPADIRIVVE